MRFSSERGFTFIEVLVAVFLLTIVTVVIVQIYNSGLFSIMVSGTRTEALYELQERLELATMVPEDEPVPGATLDFIDTIPIIIDGIDYDVKGRKITLEESAEGKNVSASIIIAMPSDPPLNGDGWRAP